jgi:diguanylate cyclase (GGDEF)-like protein
LRRAVAARLVAQHLGGVLPDEAFTAGLFLEVGLLVQARDDLSGAGTLARIPAAHRVLVERATKSEDHVSTGKRLATEWKLPESTIDAVAHHHDPAPPREGLARVAWAAERVAGVWEGGDMAALHATAVAALKQLDLSAESAESILAEVPPLVTTVGTAFERDLGAQLSIDELVLDANRRLVELNQNYEAIVRRLEDLVAEKEHLTEQLRKANLELSTLAATDSLTDLPNKRAFLQALARDLARADREAKPISLVMLDVDFFKRFNDTHGHQTGDDVLRLVGSVLKAAVRTGDVPARYGGEEFAIILPCTDAAGASIVAERIRAMLEGASIRGPAGSLRVTASLGVATLVGPGCQTGGEELVARADAALYEAKHAGRNRVRAAA